MVRVRPSLPGDSWLIRADLRQAEVNELAAIGHTCEECLRLGMLYSQAETIFIEEECAGMVGVMEGVLWGVFTKVIERYPIQFLRLSRRWIASLGPVENYVDARNTQAVKWFRWMGFEVSQPVPYGIHGELFHRFTNAPEARAEAA